MKRVITHIVALYLGAGLFAGLLMQQAIRALNAAGVAYISLTWPRQIICARTDSGCDPAPPEWIAPYLFSIKEPTP